MAGRHALPILSHMGDDRPEPRHCRIELELGDRRRCPEEACAFWEGADGARIGGCIFEELDLSGRKDVAHWLRELRVELESARDDPAV